MEKVRVHKKKKVLKIRNYEQVLKHYIREYVICKVCKSYDTVMEKENRLHFVKCSACNSRLSVAQIRQGFQAQIGKRKTQA